MNKSRLFGIFIVAFLLLTFTLQGLVQPTAAAGQSINNTKPRQFTTPQDLMRYLNTHAKQLKPAKVDALIVQLIKLQQQAQPNYEKQLFAPAINPIINQYRLADLTKLNKIKEPAIKNLIQAILADGFKLSSAEGMVYLELDYPQIRARFGRYATKPLAGYLGIMAQETSRHFADDAALMISPDELGRRIVTIEKYLGANPHFPRHADLEKLYRYYLPAYLLGLNNTPAFNYQTNRLEASFLQSYQRSVIKYRGTRFAGQIQDYLKVLLKNNYRQTKQVLAFVTKATTSIN